MAYVLPDAGFDGLWYHNPTIHFWASKGYVHWIDGGAGPWGVLVDQRFNGWPKGMELFGFLLVRATGMARLLNAFNLPFLALGVFSLVCLSRLFGASPGFSWMAGCLLLFVPVNIVLSLTSLIDPAAASCYIALMAMTAFSVGRIVRGNVSLWPAPALGAALGLAVGAKGPGIVLFPLVVVILSAALMVGSSRRPGNGSWALFRRGGLFILVAAAVTGVCGSYWHLRNLVITGSPIYPIGLRVGEMTIFPGIALDTINPPPYASGTAGWSQAGRVLFSWMENLGGWREAVTGKDPKSGGIGVIWILGCLPAIVIYGGRLAAARLRRPPPARESGFSASASAPAFVTVGIMAAVLFFAMPPHHNHKARYVLWLYGWGLPAFAAAVGWAASTPRKFLRRVGKIWALLAAAAMILEGFYAFGHQVKAMGGYAPKTRAAGSSFIRRLFDLASGRLSAGYFWSELEGTAFEWIIGDARPAAIGPLQVMSQPILGHLTQGRDFGRRRIFFLEASLADDPERAADFIRRRAIRYVIWDAAATVPAPLRRMSVLNESAGKSFRILVIDPDRAGPCRKEPMEL